MKGGVKDRKYNVSIDFEVIYFGRNVNNVKNELFKT